MAMVIETGQREERRHDWKCDPLAMMFHGLDDISIETTEADSLVRGRDMRNVAKQVYVRLGVSQRGGWGFIGRSSDGTRNT